MQAKVNNNTYLKTEITKMKGMNIKCKTAMRTEANVDFKVNERIKNYISKK